MKFNLGDRVRVINGAVPLLITNELYCDSYGIDMNKIYTVTGVSGKQIYSGYITISGLRESHPESRFELVESGNAKDSVSTIPKVAQVELHLLELELIQKVLNNSLSQDHIDELSIANGLHAKVVKAIKSIEKKKDSAVWKYWPGWSGNHDGRIDDVKCSKCGYEHPTVYGSTSLLASFCPSCGSEMSPVEN